MRKAFINPNKNNLCTKRGCMEWARWWVIKRIDGLDVDCAVCEEHSHE